MKRILRLQAILAIAIFAIMLTGCEDNNEIDNTDSAVKVKSVKLSSNATTLVAGEKDTLTATLRPANAPEETVTWVSSDDSIATVVSIGALSGEVRSHKAGTAIITVVTSTSFIDMCEVTVKDFVPLTGISIEPRGPVRIETGKYDTLYAIKGPINATNYSPVWETSNSDIVTVSQAGAIAAISHGTATVTVSSGDLSASVDIVVVDSLTQIIITPGSPITFVNPGSAQQLTATPVPADAVNFVPVWTTSDPNVVSVSQTGLITAGGRGEATVTATVGNIQASIEVKVETYYLKHNKEGWTAESRHGYHPWTGDGGPAADAGAPKYVLDGDVRTGWHTIADPPGEAPYILVVDMKSITQVDSIEIWHHPKHYATGGGDHKGWAYYNTIQVYVPEGNDPVFANVTEPQAWWGESATYTVQRNAEGRYADTNPVRIKFDQQRNGQYLILYFPDSSTQYMSFMELEVFKLFR